MTKNTSQALEKRVARPPGVARHEAPRRFTRHKTLGTRLTVIFLLAAMPAVALAFWTAHVARDQRTEEIRQQTARAAGLVASEHRRIMDGGRGLLVAIAHLPQVTNGDRGSCGRVLAQILDYYKVYANIGVADLDGNLLCSGRAPAAPGINLRDSKYFDEVLRTRDFTVGEYQVSRITNRPSISFAHPVFDASGEPIAVVIAALDLSILAWVADQMLAQLPHGSIFTILDRKGTVIARKPDDAQELGKPLADSALHAKVLSSVPGTARTEAPDGAVMHAFAPVRNPFRVEEWYTVISIPEGPLFKPLARGFRDSLLVLGLVVVIVLVVGWLAAERLVLRPAAKILDATRHMTAGNLGVRIGPDYSAGELGELARSFDGMAEALDLRKTELVDNQERLASVSRRLLAAQEDERRRIARELHDELGQLLTGAKLNLVSLQGGQAVPLSGFDPLDDTLELVGRALTTVRELSIELRPSILDDAGLEDALQWLLDRVSHRAGFEASFESEPLGPSIPSEVETTMFRFVQEALTNVMRHAAAHNVTVTLRRRGNALHAAVRDDGVGFVADVARARSLQGGSLGLLGMEERVVLAGGSIEIESMPGRGTTIYATIPITGTLEPDWENQAAS